MLFTPTQVSAYATINGTPTQTQIDSVVHNINLITNNFFVSDLCISTDADFAGGSGGTITIGSDWEDFGFSAGDVVYVSNSYRNDGYKDVASVTTSVMTLVTTSSAIAELSGRTIYFSVVQFPESLKKAAAEMIAYDVDQRDAVGADIRSHHLGPFGETFGGDGENTYGYPSKITNLLIPFMTVSLR